MKHWEDITYQIDETFLDKTLLHKYLDKFYLNIVNKIKDNQHILFIPRLFLIDNQYISLSKLILFNKENNKKDILDYLINNLNEEELEVNILDMIKRVIRDINRKKYKGYIIYLHNFAKFDGYFLLKYLAQIGCEATNPTIHKGRIISIKW
jgi:hypothetical protein